MKNKSKREEEYVILMYISNVKITDLNIYARKVIDKKTIQNK